MKLDKWLFIEMETSHSSIVNLREKQITRNEEGCRMSGIEAEHESLESTLYTCVQMLSWISLTGTIDVYVNYKAA